MEAEQFDYIQIKEEMSDAFAESSFACFDQSMDFVAIKQENESEGRPEVIYESLPWESEIRTDQLAKNTPFEVDTSSIIKTEIELGETMLCEPMVCEPEREETNETSQVAVLKSPNSAYLKQNKNKKGQNTSKIKQLQCNVCSKNFSQQEGLNKHTHQHPNELPFQCRICFQRFIEIDQIRAHESLCTIKRFECYLCRFTTLHSHLNRFLVHFRKHTGDKPFSCKICAKKFSSKRMQNFHMKYHPNEILSKCSFCQRKFANETQAKMHIADCALRRRMECYICKSTFTYISSLKRHMPQHTGATKFNCKFCQMGYVRKEYLDLHMKTHARELPFNCVICKSRFAEQSEIDKHMETCKNKKLFTCKLCDYSTVSKIYAEDHKQKHIGSDEFKCMHCPKVFLQRSKLVYHVKTHNKKAMFHCPHCQKAYYRWLFMDRHRKICPNATNDGKNI